jgi:hypothetical protein
MNESDFEMSLRALRTKAPSPELAARIREQLAEPTAADAFPARPRATHFAELIRGIFAVRLVRDFGWACAGAAAAFAIIAVSHRPEAPVARLATAPAPVAEPDAFAHKETSRELIATEDSDELYDTDDGPARQVRYSYREHHAWANPHTGARVELEVPREDVFLLPVSMQ